MQISLININEIKQAHRFDAEYFKHEYLEADNIIKSKYWKYFNKEIAEVTGGNAYHSKGFGKGEIKIAKITEISQEIDIDQWETISDDEFNLFPKIFLKQGDILISGTHHNYWDIGKVFFIDFLKIQATFNQRVFRIRFKSEIIPEFGFILFKTKFLRTQIERYSRGNNQLNLNFNEINNLKIPILPLSFQTQIESLVKQAHAKQDQSKQLYKEAEKILLQELDLLNYVPQNNLIFSTTKKHIEKIKRFDAEYFQPKYKKIIEKIELYKGGVEQIKNIVKWEKGVEVGADCYVEKGFDFVRVSDFNKYGINEIEKKISDKTYHEFKEKFEPKIGDILFTKDGTIGMSYVLKENIQGLLSGAFLRLTLKKEYKDFEKESLVLILNSIVCKMQVEQLSGGALIAHLKPSDFETFKIPLIKKEIQTNIAEKIKLSFSLKKESKELLEKAKKLVELEIEK